MAAGVFPVTERRLLVLASACLVSLLLHALLFGLPVSPPATKEFEPQGIDIDLTVPEAPGIPAQPAPSPAKEAVMAPRAEKAPVPEAAPRRVERPRNSPKKQAPARKTGPAAKGGADAAAARATTPAAGPKPAGGASSPRPPYPELARKRGQEGTVRIRCQVSAGGQVMEAAIATSSGHKLLDEAALKTVRQWKFVPATNNGANVAGTVVVPVEFRLQ